MKVLVAVLAAVTACYSPHYGDCDVQCNAGTCPAGLECEPATKTCRLPGMSGPCSAPGDAPRDTAASGVPLDMYQTAGLMALCDRLVRCGADENAAFCVEVFENFGRSSSAALIAAVAAGKVIYHADRAKTCVNGVSSIACDRDSTAKYQGNGATCATIFEGTAAGGAACAFDEECVSQFCDRSACSSAPVGTCCSGTCVGNTAPALRQINEACSKRDVCTNGYCGSSGICNAYLLGGAACAVGVDLCAPGYFCSSTTQKCVAYADTTQGCSSNNDCKHQSDVCSNSVCITGGLSNAACSAANPSCQDFYWCDSASGVCKTPPGLGESCTYYPICSAGYCNTVTKLCTSRLPDGSTCASSEGNQDCESRYCEAMADGTSICKPMPVCY